MCVIVKMKGDDDMEKIMKFITLVVVFVIFCMFTSLVYAQPVVKGIDAQSNLEATFNVEFLLGDVEVELFSAGENENFERYGKSIIKNMNNSEALLYVYSCLENGIASADTDISVYDSTYPITVDELKVVLEVYTADYPENFWFDGDCSISYNSQSQSVTRVSPKYFIDGENADKEKILNVKSVFDSKVASIINDMYENVTVGATTYETQYKYALWLHDKVADLVEYEYAPNNQNAYGAIVDGKAVCAGYAEGYQHLLNKAGINAWSIKGYSVNPGTGTGEKHEWNILWLDGNCVYSDVTWDDQGEELFHLFFARSIDEFNTDHVPYEGMYTSSIPVGNHDKCEHSGYFENIMESNVIGADVSADKIKAIYENKGNKIWDAVIYDPTATSVMNWLNSLGSFSSLIPNDFDGMYCAFTTSYIGNSAQGAEVHITAFSIDSTRLYLEPVSDLDEGKFRMVAGMTDMEKNMNLFIAFYNESGMLISASVHKPSSYYQRIHMHIPEGCSDYKIMLMNDGTFTPLCKSVSLK